MTEQCCVLLYHLFRAEMQGTCRLGSGCAWFCCCYALVQLVSNMII